MVDLQTYRIRIGSFNPRPNCRKTKRAKKPSQDELAMGLALIITLLIIGGIEQNPGPDCADEEQVPGPSFISATPMDIMESLRLTQRQLDKMANDISHLTSLVQTIICATKQVTGTSDQTDSHMSMSNALNSTDESVQEAQMGNNPSPSSQRHSDENKTEWTSPIQVKMWLKRLS